MAPEKYDFPVDLVYLWCDDGDKNWRTKRLQYQKAAGKKVDIVNAVQGRFESHDELKYSLRSAEKNIPWINHIFIVTDGQIPSFLDLNNPKITVVDHNEIIDKQYLPLFNSVAIESGIPNIPNLAEHFIYANDDTFFASPHDKSFCFTPEGKPIHRILPWGNKAKKYHIPQFIYWLLVRFIIRWKNDSFSKTCLNAIDLVRRHTGKLFLFGPGHGIDPYRKSLLQKYNSLPCMQAQIKMNLSHRFRADSDIQRVIYSCWGAAFDECEWVKIKSIYLPGANDFEQSEIDLAYVTEPEFFKKAFKGTAMQLCINDTEKSSTDFGKDVKTLLAELFPEKSGFEV